MRFAIAALVLVGCNYDLQWTNERGASCADDALPTATYWAITNGACTFPLSAPFACGVDTAGASIGECAMDLAPPLNAGTYCFLSLRVAHDDTGVCRVVAQAADDRALPAERSEIVLVPECTEPGVGSNPVWDDLLPAIAGCAPGCDPERCECVGGCTDGHCQQPIEADRISVAPTHACAGIGRGTSVSCWGDPQAFRWIDPIGEWAVTFAPEQLASGLGEIGVGRGLTCFSDAQGRVYCLGPGSAAWSLWLRGSQVLLADGSELITSNIAAGDGFACGILPQPQPGETLSHRVACWGDGSRHQTGQDTTDTTGLARLVVFKPGLGFNMPARAITAGDAHACALTNEGDVYCWGSNAAGQVDPLAPREAAGLPPEFVDSGNQWIALDAGGDRTCGIEPIGNAWCWGSGFDELGDQQALDDGTATLAEISVSRTHVCALAVDGSLYCQLQPGTYSLEPVTAPPLAKIDVGEGFVCGIYASDQSVHCLTLHADAPPALLARGHTRAGSDAVCQ